MQLLFSKKGYLKLIVWLVLYIIYVLAFEWFYSAAYPTPEEFERMRGKYQLLWSSKLFVILAQAWPLIPLIGIIVRYIKSPKVIKITYENPKHVLVNGEQYDASTLKVVVKRTIFDVQGKSRSYSVSVYYNNLRVIDSLPFNNPVSKLELIEFLRGSPELKLER